MEGRYIPVKGRSMGFTILEGDRIWIKRVDPLSVRVGDTIVYMREGGLTVHRVLFKRIGRDGVEYLTKGDGSLLPDGWIGHKDVVGKVVGLERGGRFFPLSGRRGRIYAFASFLLSHLLIPFTMIIDLWRLIIPEADYTLFRALRKLKNRSSLLFARSILPSTR